MEAGPLDCQAEAWRTQNTLIASLVPPRGCLANVQGKGRRESLDSGTQWVSPDRVNTITSKVLHEETRRCLDRVRGGERLRVVRDGQTDALLVPPDDAEDPSWAEILKDVWAAQKETGPLRQNPVLAERTRRNHAGRLR